MAETGAHDFSKTSSAGHHMTAQDSGTIPFVVD